MKKAFLALLLFGLLILCSSCNNATTPAVFSGYVKAYAFASQCHFGGVCWDTEGTITIDGLEYYFNLTSDDYVYTFSFSSAHEVKIKLCPTMKSSTAGDFIKVVIEDIDHNQIASSTLTSPDDFLNSFPCAESEHTAN